MAFQLRRTFEQILSPGNVHEKNRGGISIFQGIGWEVKRRREGQDLECYEVD